MIEESSLMASDCSLGMGGGYWYVLLHSSGVEGEKKKSLGSAASEKNG